MDNLIPFSGGLSTIGAALLIAFAVYIVLRLSGLAKGGQSVYQIGRGLQFVAEAPVRLAIRPLLWLVWKIPGAKRVAEWLWSNLTDESLQRFFDRRFEKSKNDLLRGDIEAVARKRFPPEKWPHLWLADIPEDLRRPLIVDGRLIDGSSPASILAPSFVDTVLVGQAFRQSVLAGLFWGFIALAAWHPQSYLGSPLSGKITQAGERSVQEGFDKRRPGSGMDLAYQTVGVQLQEDAWDMETLNTKFREQGDLQGKVLENRRESILASAPGGSITAILFGILVFIGTWRGLVRDAAQHKVEPLRRQQKEAVVRWKYRLDQREMEYTAYLAQLEVIKAFDKTPVIEVGTGSGVFRFRGQLSAPTKGQPMRYSLHDMAQHTLVLGGTGEGKTRSIIRPVVEKLLTLRAKAAQTGKVRMISFYCTDGKAVLWRDIKEAAEAAGQGADVKVIGCNEAAGEFGVDLLEGVDPQLVADIIRSVMRQTKGDGGSDSFWPDMAAEIIRHAAVVGRAWEMTDDGMDLVGVSGERIYSLVMIYQLALDPEVQERAVKAILAAIEDPQQWPIIEPFATVELFDSIRYMRSQWTTLADATKTGITANITNAMAPFASNAKLRAAFASGRGQNLMKIADAWGSICLVNVSSLEYGIAGRIVNVMCKTLLYTEARKREMVNPKIGFSEKLFFVADEFQDLVTSDVAGLSDSNFWNVARSTGTIGFISTQGMASLEQAIGRISAENFALQMRSKIFLRVEDPATMELAKKLAGRSLRSYTFETGRHESYDALVREEGGDPIEAGPARIVELPDNYIRALASGWLQAHKASLPVTFDTWRAAFDLDERFVPVGWKTSEEAQLSAMQSAAWRQEDRGLSYMSEGNHEADVLRDEDLVQMGRAHAFVFLQRAGASRMDIARL